jgi:ligand-binding SRPBCC domain-containing protein
MTVEFTIETMIKAPVDAVWASSLSIDAHLASMSASSERVVGGVATGQIALGETVTWRARHFGVTWTMTSKISELSAPDRFVDEQVRGPFQSFRHEHQFTSVGAATKLVDHVRFVAPLGPLGRAVESLVLGPYLRTLIGDRNNYLKAMLERLS